MHGFGSCTLNVELSRNKTFIIEPSGVGHNPGGLQSQSEGVRYMFSGRRLSHDSKRSSRKMNQTPTLQFSLDTIRPTAKRRPRALGQAILSKSVMQQGGIDRQIPPSVGTGLAVATAFSSGYWQENCKVKAEGVRYMFSGNV